MERRLSQAAADSTAAIGTTHALNQIRRFHRLDLLHRRAIAKLLSVADIVLTTLNAKYIHAAFGLRYLLANLGPLQPRACLVEFDINQRPLDIAEVLLARHPKIIGFGVYIWNVEPDRRGHCRHQARPA